MSHNPYFSRWFSAIIKGYNIKNPQTVSHNPYFSRWFSAIFETQSDGKKLKNVTILILVDGFLQ